MIQNRKTGSLLLAGLAAYAYYKYSKMTPEQKKDLTGTIKQKGKDLYDKYVPTEIKDMFEKKSGVNDDSSYTAHSEYFG
jgi:hypothetical protein